MVYLRLSIKDGSIIERLSHTGDQYKEAVASLNYNRPRLIHQTHAKKICEIPNLKDGSGRELRDIVKQHLRALKSMGQEPNGPFITSMLELKFDKENVRMAEG